MGIGKFLPSSLKHPLKRARSYLRDRSYGNSNSAIFDNVYQQKAWGSAPDTEVYSGLGTYDRSVHEYVDYVSRFMAENEVRTVVDIGCGDFTIGRQYAGGAQAYLGVDVSSVAIARNAKMFTTNKIKFLCADAASQDLPASNLCLIRQVLQHLDNKSIQQILQRTRVHKFVLITEHLPSPERLRKPNLNKRSGPDIRLSFDSGVYVELPPFNCSGEVVLSLSVEVIHVHPGETMRTTLLRNSE